MSEYQILHAELGKTRQELLKKYELTALEVMSEPINSPNEIEWFGEKLVTKLFPQDKYELLRNHLSDNEDFFITEFKFNGELLQLKVKVNKSLHSGNYRDVIEILQEKTQHGYIIGRLNPEGELVSGDKEKLLKAQKEGLPISLGEESIFWFTDFNGKRRDYQKEYYTIIKLKNNALLGQIEAINTVFYQATQSLFAISNKKRLPQLSQEQIKILHLSRTHEYRIFINGDLVSYKNIKLNEDTIQCDCTTGGKILAYGLLKQGEHYEISLKPTEKNPEKDIKMIDTKEFIREIEDNI